MAHRRLIEEHSNRDRWLVSYADFITLLFAFFVVMYSISSVNEDKYRVLSDAMVSAFKQPKSSVSPVQVGELVRTPVLLPKQEIDVFEAPPTINTPLLEKHWDLQAGGPGRPEGEDGDASEAQQSVSQRELDEAASEVAAISDDVESGMSTWLQDDIINIKRNKFWLEVEINASLLFQSGSSQLIPESIPLLRQLSAMFVGIPNRIHVEGFTDDRPINTAAFPSNWELSSARAAAVVRLFERNGVDSSRLASIGYGQNKPIATNDNDVARARNRRVVIIVMASKTREGDERLYDFDALNGTSLATGGR